MDVLQEYLVRLGFQSDAPALQQFQNMMAAAERSVTEHSSGMIKRVVEAQTAVVGAFVTMSGAIVGMVDKVAMADQGYRLMGLRMMMTTEQARSLDMITKALGADLAQITWDPESHRRAVELQKEIQGFTTALGPNFEKNMVGIRDLRMEFSKLDLATKFLGMSFVSKLFEKLNIGDIGDRLKKFTDWFIQGVKAGGWADQMAKYAVPVLKDTWEILKDIGSAVKGAGDAFSNLIGLFTRDTTIADSTSSFEKMAKAIEHIEHGMKKMLDVIIQAEAIIAHGSAALSALLGGNTQQAGKEASEAEKNTHLGSGLLVGLGGIWAAGKAAQGVRWGVGKGKAVAGAVGKAGRFLGIGGEVAEETVAAASPALQSVTVVGSGGAVTTVGLEAATGAGEAAAGVGEAAAAGGLGFLGPVGIAIGAGLGLNWLGRTLFPAFKTWENKLFGWDSDKTKEQEPSHAPSEASVAARVGHGDELGLANSVTLGMIRYAQQSHTYPIVFTALMQNETKVVDSTVEATNRWTAQSQAPTPVPTIATASSTVEPHWSANLSRGKDSTNVPLVDSLTAAIARYEAGSKANPISVRNNNPGNLRSWGSYPVVNGYVKFPDWQTGMDALHHQVEKNIARGVDLNEFFAGKPGVYPGFAPAKDKNRPDIYAGTVAKWLGIDPNVPLNKIRGTGQDRDWSAVGSYMQRPTAQTAPPVTNSSHSVTIDLGGIYVTQPNATAQQIQRAVKDGIKDALDSRVQFDQVQLQPAWG